MGWGERHLVLGEPLKQERETHEYHHTAMCPTAGPSHTETHIPHSHAIPTPQYSLTTLGPGQQHPIQSPLWPLHPMCAYALNIHPRYPGNMFVRLGSEERRGFKKRWRGSETRWVEHLSSAASSSRISLPISVALPPLCHSCSANLPSNFY